MHPFVFCFLKASMNPKMTIKLQRTDGKRLCLTIHCHDAVTIQSVIEYQMTFIGLIYHQPKTGKVTESPRYHTRNPCYAFQKQDALRRL